MAQNSEEFQKNQRLISEESKESVSHLQNKSDSPSTDVGELVNKESEPYKKMQTAQIDSEAINLYYIKNIQQVIIAQNYVRTWLTLRKVKKLREEAATAQAISLQGPKEQPTQEKISQYAIDLIGYVPLEVWIMILTYLEMSPEQVNAFAKSCKMFYTIWETNYIWYLSYKFTFPLIHIQKVKELYFDHNVTEWKSEIKSNFLQLIAYRTIIKQMNDTKEIGNSHFRGAVKMIGNDEEQEEEFRNAIIYYKQALAMEKEKEQEIQLAQLIHKGNTFYKLRCEQHQILAVLDSNWSMANLKLKHWSRALNNALRGIRTLNRLEKLMQDQGDHEKFEQDFTQLQEKLSYRLTEARKEQEFQHTFFHYSDEHEQGLGLGSLITHVDDGWGRPGIFSDSKCLMYEFTRNESIKGVIINKNHEGVRIGGPVGLTRDPQSCETVTLHNIANCPGAKKVIDGVYWQDDENLAELQPYRQDPANKINVYMGYASWFEGQLDGEIQSGGWELRNNCRAEEVFD